MIDMSPGKYFISHSYKDAAVRDSFLETLPSQVTPYIFPPISVSPLEFVSSTLIGAILACDGMIYMNEGASVRSFWVAFERDYALRTGKPVFNYTPSQSTFSHHTSPPLDLVVFPSYTRKDFQIVMPILDFMRKRRHFDVWIDSEQIKPGEMWQDKLEKGISGTIKRGGYVTTFWGTNESEWVMRETLRGLEEHRVIVAGLGSQPPLFIQKYHDMFVQLMENGQINNNRIDDLIVRLYWLIFQNQFPEFGV
jgi:hypothetical protein